MNRENLVWEIYAVDRKDWTHFVLIGTCFNKGLAKSWVESCITADNFMNVNKDTKQTEMYDHKEKKWK